MEEQTTIPQDLVVIVKDLNIAFSMEFEKQGRGECKIPICDEGRLRIMWSYEGEMNEEEDKKAKEREEREKAKTAEEKKEMEYMDDQPHVCSLKIQGRQRGCAL